MPSKKLFISTVLAATILVQNLQASVNLQSAFGRCDESRQTVSGYSILLSPTKDKKNIEVVAISSEQGWLRTQRLGQIATADLPKLNVTLRRLTGLVGLPVLYAGATVGAVGVGGTMAANGMAVSINGLTGGIAFKVVDPFLVYFGRAVVLSTLTLPALPVVVNNLNPVYQYERAAIEKCLVTQFQKAGRTTALTLSMNDRDDLEDAIEQLKGILK